MDRPSFRDKKILITGASKGLGAVCARSFAQDGARLALMARSVDKLRDIIEETGAPDDHMALGVDCQDLKAVREGTEKVMHYFGEIDIVLHVVGGGYGMHNPLLSAQDFMKLLTVNVTAAIEINHLVAPKMVERKNGNLVHVCSIASAEATGSVGYNTVKAALAAYVRSLGRELAASGVVATGILPGGFYAPENAFARLKEKNPQGYADFIQNRLPRKFLADAEELIPLIKLLSSDQASMMAGCLVPIDAGEGRSFVSV